MNDEKQLLVESKDQTLADASDSAHLFPAHRIDRRLDRPQNEWARQDDPLDSTVPDVLRQGIDVDDQIREFWQGSAHSSGTPCASRESIDV
jgi:acetyl-CoA carboxylase carboxyltransferase component